MATSYIEQAQSQLNPLYDQQQAAIQGQLPSIENLYNTLTQGLQGAYQQNLSSGVQGIVEDASARGVLRSTLPVDARQALTGQLGAALQQSLGELGAKRASDVAGVQTNLAQLGVERAGRVSELARALETQDLERQQLEMQKLNSEREYRLKQQELSSGGSSGGFYTRPSSSGGTNFYDAGGNPVTAAQYFSGVGGTTGDLRQFLQSTPSGQKALSYLDANGVEKAKAKYPYIFAGV